MVLLPVAFPASAAPAGVAPGRQRATAAGQDIDAGSIDALAARIAALHAASPAAPAGTRRGDPDRLLALGLRQLRAVAAFLAPRCGEADDLAAWLRTRHHALRHALLMRGELGFVRTCRTRLRPDHGGAIDVLRAAADLATDLTDRGRADLAHRFLDGYLAGTGDDGGVQLLALYLVHSALARAWSTCLRGRRAGDDRLRAALRADCRDAVRLAAFLARPRRPVVVLMHGLTGSGTTTFALALRDLVGAIRLPLDGKPPSPHPQGGDEADRDPARARDARVACDRVLARALQIVAGGFTALVDGPFLYRWQRELFRRGAAELGIPFCMVSVQATLRTVRERAAPAAAQHLEREIATQEPLAPDERADVVVHDGEAPACDVRSTPAWRALAARVPLVEPQAVPPTDDEAVAAQRATVAHLSRPASYPEPTSRVERVETHMSWVFLTDARAFKMKKHARTRYVDLCALHARRRNCAEEVRLNRRLADDVYLGVVPLFSDDAGRLSFDGGAEVAEWLVCMRRLPADRMMDRLIRQGAVGPREIDAIVARLCDFYRHAPRPALSPGGYRDRLAAAMTEARNELSRPEFAMPVGLVEDVYARQRAMLRRDRLFDDRVRDGRIVEGHGDLRPEHVCLEPTPRIIDCLDFSRDLRTLDSADEIAFLALECERLGAPAVGVTLLQRYRDRCGDSVPDELVGFYRSCRACIRATLAIRHLDEPVLSRAKWQAQARDYLELARRALASPA
ncbi:MAG TPA: AAA family ATPase [Casimicrobiaceae bacterium]|nr:AAA family ATPase [Casimicrobiaceae bacterium]